jgi:hypothetical protein
MNVCNVQSYYLPLPHHVTDPLSTSRSATHRSIKMMLNNAHIKNVNQLYCMQYVCQL